MRSFLRSARLSVPALFLALGSSGHRSHMPFASDSVTSDTAPPPIEREFRGVWIATVGNMDWPSRPGLSTWQQQAEIVDMLNRVQAMHMNAIIFQVRPEADALYQSKLEPWSPFLTGEMGRAPEPYYDPLAFIVREAHARGIEVHAWFNPYRAKYSSSPGELSPSHVARADPSLVRKYGDYLWMDPGNPEVVERSVRAILDVVHRYDIDGIHIDDYFYPYLETDRHGRTIDFPDAAEYKRYRKHGGRLSRGDWRRDNVNKFVERIGGEIHAVKPWVRFGISPFGIWRPGYPASVRGLDSYSEIFADSRKWLESGWVDYLAPQLYWPVDRPQQSYTELLSWWVAQNHYGRHIWPGLNASLARPSEGDGRGAAELIDQIRLTRAQPGASGEVFFSMKVLDQDPDSIAEKLTDGSYSQEALVPATPWLDKRTPPAPVARERIDDDSGDLVVDLAPPTGEQRPWLWVVQSRLVDRWTTQIIPGSEVTHVLAASGAAPPLDVRVYAVGRTGNQSAAVKLPIEPIDPFGASVRIGGR